MNRHLASAYSLVATAFAAASVAAIASGNAYAESPTVDNTPFVSTRSRAEVQAELMSQRGLLSASGSEWVRQRNQPTQVTSALTRAEAKSQYIASRQEVSALTSEDSGSSYFATQPIRMQPGTSVAGFVR
jgi:hypothetical protein